jgi:hypothetical protein
MGCSVSLSNPVVEDMKAEDRYDPTGPSTVLLSWDYWCFLGQLVFAFLNTK